MDGVDSGRTPLDLMQSATASDTPGGPEAP